MNIKEQGKGVSDRGGWRDSVLNGQTREKKKVVKIKSGHDRIGLDQGKTKERKRESKRGLVGSHRLFYFAKKDSRGSKSKQVSQTPSTTVEKGNGNKELEGIFGKGEDEKQHARNKC